MLAENKITLSELVSRVRETGFNIIGLSEFGIQESVIVKKNGYVWKITRREWDSASGKHFVRFSVELLRKPEESSWKGSVNVYTRRNGEPRSFPYSSKINHSNLHEVISYLLYGVKRYVK